MKYISPWIGGCMLSIRFNLTLITNIFIPLSLTEVCFVIELLSKYYMLHVEMVWALAKSFQCRYHSKHSHQFRNSQQAFVAQKQSLYLHDFLIWNNNENFELHMAIITVNMDDNFYGIYAKIIYFSILCYLYPMQRHLWYIFYRSKISLLFVSILIYWDILIDLTQSWR